MTAAPSPSPRHAGFGGRRVLALESRRATELASLVVTFGGHPVVAPALREAPLESNTAAIAFLSALMRREVDVVVLLTGVGTRALASLAERLHGRHAFAQALARPVLVSRGPKPVAALRELGLAPWMTAPKPHTWREILIALDERRDDLPLRGARLAVQEYGVPNRDLARELKARGAVVTSVPIYQWLLPEDIAPLRGAVDAIARGELDAVLLTSSIQMVHLLQVAADMGCEADVRSGLQRMIIASIGPMTSDELRRQGLEVDLEPTMPKMGVLVKEAAERCGHLLRAKCKAPLQG
jgi:uroporphyrinogen-III synthase